MPIPQLHNVFLAMFGQPPFTNLKFFIQDESWVFFGLIIFIITFVILKTRPAITGQCECIKLIKFRQITNEIL